MRLLDFTLFGRRFYLGWSSFPRWEGRRFPVPLKGGQWAKAYRFPGPFGILYASISLGWGHIYCTMDPKQRLWKA